jgi:hypothetical protein
MARREAGEYATYSTDEQRRQCVKDQASWEQNSAVEALGATISVGFRRQKARGNRHSGTELPAAPKQRCQPWPIHDCFNLLSALSFP